MDSLQTRILLRKINQLFDSVEHTPSGPSRIELDLLRDYTRQFYEELTNASKPETRRDFGLKPLEAVPTAPPVLPQEPENRYAETSKPEPVSHVAAQIPKPPVPEPVKLSEQAEVETLTMEPEPVVSPKHAATPATMPSGPVKNGNGDSAALFSSFEAKDLSDKLRLSRIDDLAKAMGINERFLTINELFKGDHEAFDRILRSLNNLQTFQDARNFLEAEVIPQYGWLDEKKQKKAGIFIQLVQRRYL